MNSIKHFCIVIQKGIRWCGVICFAVILLLLLLGAGRIPYAYRTEFPCSNWLYLFFGILICGAVGTAEYVCPETVKRYFRNNSGRLIGLLTILFFGLQLYVVSNYYFITGWDAGVLCDAARGIAEGQAYGKGSFLSYYFSTYPNNLFLLSVFSGIMKLDRLFGFLDVESGMMGILTVQCMISALTGVLVFYTALLWKSSVRTAWNSWGLYVCSAGISPWVSIPYSDAFGMFVPILILYLYLSAGNGRRTGVKCFALAAVAAAGFWIKPQLAVMGIAAGLTAVIRLPRKHEGGRGRIGKNVVSLAAGAAAALLAVQAAVSSVPVEVDREETFGPAHILMMGLNPVTNGGYLEEDVLYSHEQPADERTQANLDRIGQRLAEYGPAGLSAHLAKKLLTSFSDGTWAWGREGGFYRELKTDRNQKMSPFLKSVYYEDGSRHEWFQNWSQAVWMLILAGCFLSFFDRKNDGNSPAGPAALLALIGLTLFVLLFEARARYLYCYVPVFVLLSVSGWETAGQFLAGSIRRAGKVRKMEAETKAEP